MDNDVFGKLGLRVRVRVRSIIKKLYLLLTEFEVHIVILPLGF